MEREKINKIKRKRNAIEHTIHPSNTYPESTIANTDPDQDRNHNPARLIALLHHNKVSRSPFKTRNGS